MADARRRRALDRPESHRHDLAHQDVVRIDERIFRYESIGPQLFIVGLLHMFRQARIGLAETFFLSRRLILLLLVLVRSIEDGAKETPVQRRTVNHYGILLVIAAVRHNRYDNVESRRHLLGPVVLAHKGRHERLRRVAKQIAHRVHPLPKVQGKDAHRLLPHRRLIRIARRLIVVTEGNVGSHRTENDRRMNLDVGVVVLHRRIGLGDVEMFRFSRIHKFEKSVAARRHPSHQLVKGL